MTSPPSEAKACCPCMKTHSTLGCRGRPTTELAERGQSLGEASAGTCGLPAQEPLLRTVWKVRGHEARRQGHTGQAASWEGSPPPFLQQRVWRV